MASFTDRFIRVPIEVYDRQTKELTGVELSEESYMMLNPFEISHYRPSYDPVKPDVECTLVSFKNGNEVLVYLTIGEFEKLLNQLL